MTDATTEAAYARDAAALRDRDDLLVLLLRGDDQRSWLNGQITQDVRHTEKGQAVYALAVTVKGKIIAEVWALDRGEDLALLVPRSARDALVKSFESQIIMEDVELEDAPRWRVFSVQGPKAVQAVGEQAHVYPCDELGLGGAFVLVPEGDAANVRNELQAAAEAVGGGAISAPGWELARLRSATPGYGVDFDEARYPQEAGLERRAVSFNKGCYLGQEVICTLESRGRLSRRLVRMVGDGAITLAVGDALHSDDGSVVGAITSTARDPEGDRLLALGYVKRAQAEAGQVVHSGGHPLTVDTAVGA